MSVIRETASAKLNLTLRVLGRRADGFHELESVVAFAGVHDTVELRPDDGFSLAVEGPFAGALGSDNLVTRAAEAAQRAVPSVRLGHFRLFKELPVEAGIGGGSADAAATLRAIARANPGALGDETLHSVAAGLGSDVTVCLASRPALIASRGEQVEAVGGFPSCAVLLANPALKLATEAVYAALGAPPLSVQPNRTEPPNFGGDFERLLDYLLPRGNDLEDAAVRLAPPITDVLAALAGLKGARLARLSGSGPTCFALFATEQEAKHAAATLAAKHPDWWITATTLGVMPAKAGIQESPALHDW